MVLSYICLVAIVVLILDVFRAPFLDNRYAKAYLPNDHAKIAVLDFLLSKMQGWTHKPFYFLVLKQKIIRLSSIPLFPAVPYFDELLYLE